MTILYLDQQGAYIDTDIKLDDLDGVNKIWAARWLPNIKAYNGFLICKLGYEYRIYFYDTKSKLIYHAINRCTEDDVADYIDKQLKLAAKLHIVDLEL